MAPLELAAAGRPTIAYRAGGAIETIVDGVTGVFFDRQEPEDLAAAIQRFERMEWSPVVLRRHAENFSVEVFQSRIYAFLAHIGAPVRDVEPTSWAGHTSSATFPISAGEGIPA
jgi:glycosyltransferase involved in cell wall biosynthesis